MDKSQHKKSEPGLFRKGQRYRSIMLVGEHGRVIPFRHFKAIAIAITALATFSTLALGVLGILYFLQGQRVEHLRSELDRWQHQARVLKDEKDVLKAQLVIRALQKNTKAVTTAVESKPAINVESKPTSNEKPAEQTVQTQKASAAEPAPRHQPAIHWRADIRQFEVKYDAKSQSLKTKFRIYNTSTPKKTLSGRIVLAFKVSGDPPIKWMAVPNVPFVDGKPPGRSGRFFSVRNYLTIKFKTERLKAPIAFNSVGVYLYSSNGELILTRDFDFKMPSYPFTATTPTPPTGIWAGKSARRPAGAPISPPASKPVGPPVTPPVSPQTSKPVSPPASKPATPSVSPPANKPVTPPAKTPAEKESQVTSAPSQGGGEALKGSDQKKPPDPEKVDSASELHHETRPVQESSESSHTSSPKENGSER
jgi:hypothetical protein